MACSSYKKSESLDKSMYIYNLPYKERKALCKILDVNDAWEDLGGDHLGFDVIDLYRFKQATLRHASPTDELLCAWGIQNHTVLELFIYLGYMHHYQAMVVLQPLVPEKYHDLIYKGEENPLRLVNSHCSKDVGNPNPSNNSGNKDLEFGAHNMDQSNKFMNLEPSSAEKKILNTDTNKDGNKLDPLKLALEGHIPMISYAELEEASGGWSARHILGKGGFGTVYKGSWKFTDVAIKRLEYQPEKATDDKSKFQNQLFTELRSLNTFRHDNILPLYGFSVGGTHDCLIYQFMPNGSLEDKILCRNNSWPLPWIHRHNIAIGVARGLQFLHTFAEKPLVHGDIKSANILLDPSYVPKIGDFGLAREGPLENYTYIRVTRVHGTKPYLPDEFLRDRKFSTKVDVYSYGIVLFELASGLRAYDDKRKYKLLKDHVESISDDKISVLCDPKIEIDENISFSAFISLGKQCTAVKSKTRPEMVAVLQHLEYSLNLDDINRRIPGLYSARPSIQSDLPLTRDRQVTASVQPHNSPIPPINIDAASSGESTSFDYSSSYMNGSLSVAKSQNGQLPNANGLPSTETPSPQPLEHPQGSPTNSDIPALSQLLSFEN